MTEIPNERILVYQNIENAEDVLYSFLEEFAEEVMGAFIAKAELFKVFKEFCEKYCLNQVFYLNETSFGRLMKNLGYKDGRRTINNKRCYVWLGIRMWIKPT